LPEDFVAIFSQEVVAESYPAKEITLLKGSREFLRFPELISLAVKYPHLRRRTPPHRRAYIEHRSSDSRSQNLKFWRAIEISAVRQ
jgi:hypothetical protein